MLLDRIGHRNRFPLQMDAGSRIVSARRLESAAVD
jgi:hypothetical protein